jgi:mannan endo-1,4-beta-mannosidase
MGDKQYTTDRVFSRRKMLKICSIGGFAAVAGCSSNDSGSTTTVTEVTVDPRRQSVITTQSDDLTTSPQPTTASATRTLPSRQITTGQTNTSSQSTSLGSGTTTPLETASNQSNRGEIPTERTTNLSDAGVTTSEPTPTATSTTESTSQPTPTTTTTVTSAEMIEPPSEPILAGAYISESDTSSVNIGLFKDWLDQTPALAMQFAAGLTSQNWPEQFINTRIAPIWETGAVPILTWLPSIGSPDETPPRIAREIAAGEHDSIINEWATQLSAWLTESGDSERRLYFRPAHEMNGDWFPWSAADSSSTPDDHIEMWQRLHDMFSENGLDETTIQWIWSPNVDEIGGVRAEAYYPGDGYVDWVGLDGFNFGDTQSYSNWRTPEEVFLDMHNRMRDLTDKPVGLTEFASSSFRDDDYRPAAKAIWIKKLFRFVADHDIRMTCWFNVEKSGPDEADWAVFGGNRGTETHAIDGETYNTYDSYHASVNSPSTIRGSTDEPSRLTDQQFSGGI